MAYADRGYRHDEPRYENGTRRRNYGRDRDVSDRAGDEVRSWFGDDEAEYRRRRDEMADPDTHHAGGRSRHRTRGHYDSDRDYNRDRSGYGFSDESGYRRGTGSYDSDYDRGRGERGHFEGWRAAGGDYDYDDDRDYRRNRSYYSRGEAERGYGRSHDDEYRSGAGTAYRGGMTRYSSDDDYRYGGAYRDDDDDRPSYRGHGPKNYKRSKEQIHDEIGRTMTHDHDLDAREIEVKCKDEGEVTLDGYVNSRRDKRRAEYHAYEVTGVRHVQNNLRIHDKHDSVAADPEATNEVGTTTSAAKKNKTTRTS